MYVQLEKGLEFNNISESHHEIHTPPPPQRPKKKDMTRINRGFKLEYELGD